MIVDNFLPDELAYGMRCGIDDHFSNTNEHGARHQVWNYWFVPGLYTYLRTMPEKIIPVEYLRDFQTRMIEWSLQNLELRKVTWPWLSLYVDGCRQSLHNDADNGRYGFVYSLTTNESLIGGRTMLLKQEDMSRRAAAGTDFFDYIEPKFNRLVVFDDKIPHAVEQVEGSMDPKQGRFVLHGHIQ